MSAAKLKISSVSANGFWRCGRHFTKTGVLVTASDFSEKQLERLKGEPMLRVAPATKEDAGLAEERAAAIAAGIKTLAAQDFQRDGKPKIDALNELLGDELGKIAVPERNEIWDQLVRGGFKAPEPAA
ncbi:hypothetical protein ACFP4H_12715 [Pseudophaeobacter arcticus]|uniref:hypothetical protein n=1 Tax=Pseudophaeobacter arcticus TaxID=385492 RepID=UPI000403B51F|nr:hypothetical protein [Pseudophaeobacter arcticus]